MLWKRIFQKLYCLASSTQIEVKKHNLKNLENIFMKHGASISSNTWLEVLNNNILDLLKSHVRNWQITRKTSEDSEDGGDGAQECCLMLIQIMIRCLRKLMSICEVPHVCICNNPDLSPSKTSTEVEEEKKQETKPAWNNVPPCLVAIQGLPVLLKLITLLNTFWNKLR